MADAATPAENQQTPPASPAAIPATEGGNTPPAQDTTQGTEAPEDVTLTKEAHDTLVKDAGELPRAVARQSASDRKVIRLEKILKSKKKGSHFNTPSGEAPSEEDVEAAKDEQALEEDRKATQGIMGLALDPIYRAVFDADPTLRTLVTTNPLGVLPLLAPDAVDAEDAIQLVKDELQTRADKIKEAKDKKDKDDKENKDNKEGNQPTTPPQPGIPPQIGANIPSATQGDAELEAARKNPNTEGAIASMIKVGIGRMGKK